MVFYTLAFTRNAEMLSESGGCAWLFCVTAVRVTLVSCCLSRVQPRVCQQHKEPKTTKTHETLEDASSQECPYDSVIYMTYEARSSRRIRWVSNPSEL